MRKNSFLLLLCFFMGLGLCCCGKQNFEENYFGGKGEIRQTKDILQDDANFYFGFGLLKKFNMETKSLSVACQTPGCDHSSDNPECKANLTNSKYCIFDGNLVKEVDEVIVNPDGTTSVEGYLYLGEEGRQVFKNRYPASFTDEQKETSTCSIGVLAPLNDNYLALICSGFMYILDADFNIKFTVLDMGPYSGGIYSSDRGIYYISSLYHLMELNMETGETSEIDLGSMKITEGVLYDGQLWFSNEDQSLCTYDFNTGETKERIKNAVRLTLAGKYIEFLRPSYSEDDTSEIHLLNLETGEDRKWGLAEDYIDLFYVDGNYYSYDLTAEDAMTQYSQDLSDISNVYTLED